VKEDLQTTETMTSQTTNGIDYRKIGLLALVLVVGWCVFVLDVRELQGEVTNLITFIHSLGYWAPIIFFLIHTTAVTVCFPATMLFELGAGFIFGLWMGVPLVMLSKTSGAAVGFTLGRTLLHDWVKDKLKNNQRFRNIDHHIGGKESWKIAFLLRLSPFPSWFNTYGLSITSIRFLPFIVATMIGSIPMIIQNVYVGSLLSSAASIGTSNTGGSNIVKNLMFAMGLVATVLISRMMMRYASSKTMELEKE
jgi:uncharacterized membrane protein YdjX (TVP38/TMEM64 family)